MYINSRFTNQSGTDAGYDCEDFLNPDASIETIGDDSVKENSLIPDDSIEASCKEVAVTEISEHVAPSVSENPDDSETFSDGHSSGDSEISFESRESNSLSPDGKENNAVARRMSELTLRETAVIVDNC